MNFRLTLPQPHSRILSLCILFSSVYLWIKPCSSFVNIVLPFSGDSPFSASWATENISFEKTNRKIIKINVTTFYTALLFKLYTHTHIHSPLSSFLGTPGIPSPDGMVWSWLALYEQATSQDGLSPGPPQTGLPLVQKLLCFLPEDGNWF